MGSQQFCLKWNNHQTNLLSVFDQLLQNEAFVDVTIACEGLSLKAHKMVLSACSPYFQTLFLENPCKHPIVILNSIRYSELKAIIDFMYKGEVNVSQDQLSALLKTAEMLKVKGLAEVTNQTTQSLNVQMSEAPVPAPSPPVQLTSAHNHRGNSSPPPKRKKIRTNHSSSAANSPQISSGLMSNSLCQPKNASGEHSADVDQKPDPHMPVAVEHSQDDHANQDGHLDQNTVELPPKLLVESSAEMTDDQSSMSNVTTDLGFDHQKADQMTQEHSGPPDISSSAQAVPSTSGMQSTNQDGTFLLPVKTEFCIPYIAEDELIRIKDQSGNIKQFATALAKLLFTREERRECNTYAVGKHRGLDEFRVSYLRQLVLDTYQVPPEICGEAWNQCVTAINAHCRYLRWKDRFDKGCLFAHETSLTDKGHHEKYVQD